MLLVFFHLDATPSDFTFRTNNRIEILSENIFITFAYITHIYRIQYSVYSVFFSIPFRRSLVFYRLHILSTNWRKRKNDDVMLFRVRSHTHTQASQWHRIFINPSRKERREKNNQKKNVVPTTTEWQSSDVLVLLFFLLFFFSFVRLSLFFPSITCRLRNIHTRTKITCKAREKIVLRMRCDGGAAKSRFETRIVF